MLCLAEVIKEKRLLGYKTKLKLLAHQKSKDNWVFLNEEVIPETEVNGFEHGTLIFISLNSDKKIKSVEPITGKVLMRILRQLSVISERYQSQEEEIEQWKQSLTYCPCKQMPTGKWGAVVYFLIRQFEEIFLQSDQSYIALARLVGVRVCQRNRWDDLWVPSITVLPLEQWQALSEREATIELNEQPPLLLVDVFQSLDERHDDSANSPSEVECALLKIPEYWKFDINKKKITVYVLDNHIYKVIEYEGDTLIRSSILPSLHLSVTEILSSTI